MISKSTKTITVYAFPAKINSAFTTLDMLLFTFKNIPFKLIKYDDAL